MGRNTFVGFVGTPLYIFLTSLIINMQNMGGGGTIETYESPEVAFGFN